MGVASMGRLILGGGASVVTSTASRTSQVGEDGRQDNRQDGRADWVEPLERRLLMAPDLSVNFQPSGASVPAGFVADTGAVFAARGNGFSYGWDADNAI